MMLLQCVFLLLCFKLTLGSNPGMGGINLVLNGYHLPPFHLLYLHPDGNYSDVGSNGEIFNWLAQRLNFSITLKPVVDKEIIAKIGVIEAASIQMINQEVDGFLGVSVITPFKAQWMDYTCGIIWAESYNLVVPRPKYESRLFAFIRPFTPVVWMMLGLCVIVFVCVMSCFSKLYERNTKNQRVFGNRMQLTFSDLSMTNMISFYTVYVVNILTNHGAYTYYYRHSFRILVGSWLLTAFVLVNSYSSIVVSCLTLPTLKPAVNSFEDLANSKEVSMISMKSVVLTQIILAATSGTHLLLGNQLRSHPERLFLQFSSGYQMLDGENYALPWISSTNRIFVATKFRSERKCRFQLSDPLPIAHFMSAVVMRKGFKYTSLMSHGLTELWESGLTLTWVKNLSPRADQCFDKRPPKSTTAVPIKLVDLISAFLLLGIGMGFSILSFLIELCFALPTSVDGFDVKKNCFRK